MPLSVERHHNLSQYFISLRAKTLKNVWEIPKSRMKNSWTNKLMNGINDMENKIYIKISKYSKKQKEKKTK